MFGEELNEIDDLSQSGWDGVDGVVDMEGELRFALVELDESAKKNTRLLKRFPICEVCLIKERRSLMILKQNLMRIIKNSLDLKKK